MSKEQHRNALPQGLQLEEYQIDSMLGHGGFGITYLAKDTHLDQWVAIKEYLPNELAVRDSVSTVYAKSTSDEEAFQWGLQRFIVEARTLAHFKHPNIVRVLRFFEAHGTAYMVMEYQEGKNLSEYLAEKACTEKELMEIFLPLLDGLQEIHAAGFLHRDIKPGNIFIRKDDVPILLDFGAARYAIGEKSSTLTSVVSPGYAPFEQYDSKSVQGAWTDIYAMGGVLYYALTKKVPDEVVGRLKHDDMPRAAEVGKGKYRQELLKAVDWALALDEEARPQTVAEWREALLAPPLEIMPEPRPPAASALRTRLKTIAWGGIALLIVLSGAYLLYQQVDANRPLYRMPQPQTEGSEVPAFTKKLIEDFTKSYFTALEQADIDGFVEHYAERVNYYAWGEVGRDTVRKEKTEYFQLWPQVKYTLAGPIELFNAPREDEIIVKYVVDFRAHNPRQDKGPNTSTGQALHQWRLRSEAAGLKIVQESQKSIKRDKSYE